MKKLILKMCVFGIFVVNVQSAKAQNPNWGVTPSYYDVENGNSNNLPPANNRPIR